MSFVYFAFDLNLKISLDKMVRLWLLYSYWFLVKEFHLKKFDFFKEVWGEERDIRDKGREGERGRERVREGDREKEKVYRQADTDREKKRRFLQNEESK